ncbi:MAG: UvrB/UvrC motif-containing protein, partial [Solirubrobacteraceae bacterium]
ISDIAAFLQSDSSKVPKSRRRRQRAADAVPPAELERTIVEIEEEMLAAAEELKFEYAAKLRDEIRDLKRELDQAVATGRASIG